MLLKTNQNGTVTFIPNMFTSGNENFSEIDIELSYLKDKRPYQSIKASDTITVHSKCPICSANHLPIVQNYTQSNELVTERSFCPVCEFIFFSKIPNEQWYENYYKKTWQKNQSLTVIENKVKIHAPSMIQALEPHLKNHSLNILEIGCGYGGILNELRTRGFKNIFGIEPSMLRATYASKVLNLAVFEGTAENIRTVFDQKKFDIIFYHHAMEHVFDLNKAFNEMSAVLNPGGVLVVIVPSLKHEADPGRLGWFLPHVSVFNITSFKTLLTKHHFKTLSYNEDDSEIKIVGVKEHETSRLNMDAVTNASTDHNTCAVLRSNFFKSFQASRFAAFPTSNWLLTGNEQLRSDKEMGHIKLIDFYIKRKTLRLDPYKGFVRSKIRRVLAPGKNFECGFKVGQIQQSATKNPPLVRFRFSDSKAIRMHIK